MNRFINKDLKKAYIETTFFDGQGKAECFQYKCSGYMIESEDFNVLCDLDLYHYPNERSSKMNSFNINNIEVHTDEMQLKLSGDEYETIYKKIAGSIEIIGCNY